MLRPGFWDHQESAQAVVAQLSALKALVEPVEEMQREVKDLAELYELAADEADADELTQLETDVKALERRCEQVEDTFTLLWHNSSLDGEWRPWAEMYERVVRVLAGMQGNARSEISAAG